MVQNYDGMAISQLGNIYSIRKDTKNNIYYIIIIIIIINRKECLPMQYCSYRQVIFPMPGNNTFKTSDFADLFFFF